jgi:hypothetical protein
LRREPPIGVFEIAGVGTEWNAEPLPRGCFDAAFTKVDENDVLRDSLQPRRKRTRVRPVAPNRCEGTGKRLGGEVERDLLVTHSRPQPAMEARRVANVEAEKGSGSFRARRARSASLGKVITHSFR